MKSAKLYHVSEEAGIKIFKPRPSPFHYKEINSDVVFAISEKLLHNYLLPRNCPRVTYYSKPDTTPDDKNKFFGQNSASYIITIEETWFKKLHDIVLYCYEFSSKGFKILDKCAGYYISSNVIEPLSVKKIDNITAELEKRKNVELRIVPSLIDLANNVSLSTLAYSIIRLKKESL